MLNLPKSSPAIFDIFDCFIVPQSYKCKHCDFKHNVKVVVKNHTSVYHEGKSIDSLSKSLLGYYKCEYGDFRTYTALAMLKHQWFKCIQRPSEQEANNTMLKFVWKENSYKCPRCTYQTQHRTSLSRHMQLNNHKGVIEQLHCKLCPYKCKYDRQLRDHVLIKHSYYLAQSSSEQESTVKDVLETQNADSKDPLGHTCPQSRLNMHHETIEQSDCNFCSDYGHPLRVLTPIKHTYSVKRPLKRGNNLKEQMVKDSLERRKMSKSVYKCARCNFQTRHRSILNTHMLKWDHQVSKHFECKLCSYQCEYYHEFKNHVLINHTVLPLSRSEQENKSKNCVVEKGVARRKMSKRVDLKINKMQKCPQCNYQTRFRCLLDRHMLKYYHEAIKEFACNICSYKCESNHQLRDHVLIKHTLCSVGM